MQVFKIFHSNIVQLIHIHQLFKTRPSTWINSTRTMTPNDLQKNYAMNNENVINKDVLFPWSFSTSYRYCRKVHLGIIIQRMILNIILHYSIGIKQCTFKLDNVLLK